LVCGCGDFAHLPRAEAEKTPRFRGVLAIMPAGRHPNRRPVSGLEDAVERNDLCCQFRRFGFSLCNSRGPLRAMSRGRTDPGWLPVAVGRALRSVVKAFGGEASRASHRALGCAASRQHRSKMTPRHRSPR